MKSFSEVIGDAMTIDPELFELAKWGEEMFLLQDEKNANKHWTAKYIDDENAVYNQEDETDWDFPEPPEICR